MIPAIVLVVVVAAILVAGARKPALWRLAWRQASGRPSQALVLVGGLMVGSAALTASLVAVDSAQRLATRIELLRWGTTDVTVTSERPFPIDLADVVSADPEVRQNTESVVPQLQLGASLADISTQRTESVGTVIGYDAAHDAPLGDFTLIDGTRAGDVGPNDILMNERAATRLGAHAGDTVAIVVGATGESQSLTVRGVARMRGKAAWGFESVGFVRLALAQKLAKAPDAVNLLRVIAPKHPERAVATLNDAMAKSGLPLRAVDAKRQGLASARAQTKFLRYALIAISTFILLAAIALIVNLVVMLAEERARQLGMLRALGMRRSSLVVIGAMEGAVYSVTAGAAGAGAGLAIGALLARFLQNSFQRFFLPGGRPLPFLFRPSLHAALAGFTVGTLVALFAIALAWRRAGRLNVTAAIRGLAGAFPRRRPRPGLTTFARTIAVMAALGALVVPEPAVKEAAGVIALAVVMSMLKNRWSMRVRVSALSLGIVAWALAAAGNADIADPRSFMQFFVTLNVVEVFAFSVLVAANLGSLERGAALLGKRSAAARQTLRPVLAYLARRPLRTGLTVGIFGLVLSLVTAAATVLATDQPRYEDDASGYQIVATTIGSQQADLTASPDVEAVRMVRFRLYRGGVSLPGVRAAQISMMVYEATPAITSLPLAGRDPKIGSDREAWKRVLDGTRAVGSLVTAGQPLRFETSGTRVVNAGFLRAGRLLYGTIVGPDQFSAIPGEVGTTYLVRARAGASAALVARSLEKTWFADGLDASTTRALVDQGAEDLRAFFAIVQFMAHMALAIGIISLGIIALRAAFERRRMLGTLRALGYRRRTVLIALMIESMVVTTAGAVVGAGGGLLLNRFFFKGGFHGVDMGLLGGTLLLTYVAVLLVSAGPAIRAAHMSPADAIRTVD
ncbi:MAG: FtsX-like permease family protein [Actinomycetota bacterium]|nr:ABC transporter permease [Actinomycetota bacterium]